VLKDRFELQVKVSMDDFDPLSLLSDTYLRENKDGNIAEKEV